MRKAFGVEAELVRGGGGVFDVEVDGRVVYSKQKHECGAFPDESALIEGLKAEAL